MNELPPIPMYMRLLLAIALLFAMRELFAAEPRWEEPARIQKAALGALAGELTSADRAQAQVDERLRLPACDGALEAFRVPGNGGGNLTVGVRCPTSWTIYVPVRVSARREVLVAARPLARGEVPDASALRLEVRELAGLSGGYFTDAAAVAGQQMKHAVPAGQALAPSQLIAPFAVRRGQRVTLVSRSGGFMVQAAGQAMADGAVNQRIRVQNLGSQRVVEGVVRSGDTVEVGL